jgi:hypothetical protein
MAISNKVAQRIGAKLPAHGRFTIHTNTLPLVTEWQPSKKAGKRIKKLLKRAKKG